MKLNRKNKILLIGFIFSLCLCYSFAISKTLFYRNEYLSRQDISAGNNNPKILAQLKHKENQIDKWFSENKITSSNFQNELLKQLNLYCDLYKLKIVDFQVPHNSLEKGMVIMSYSFSLEGGFNNVLILLNKIENAQNLGQIKHIYTQKKTNFKTNQDYLITTVIIQKPADK